MQHLLQFGLSNAVAAAALAVLAAVATRVWRNPHFAYALWLVVLLRLVAPPLLPVGLPVPQWIAESFREPLPVVSESQTVIRPPVGISASIAQSTGGPKLPPVAPEPARPALSSRATAVRASALVAPTPVLEDRGDPEGAPPRGSLGMSQDVSKGVSQLPAFRWPSMANLVAVAWLTGTLCYLLLTAFRVRRFSRVLRRARRVVPAGVAAEAVEVSAAVGLRRVPRLAFAQAALPPMVWPGWRPVVLLPEALFTSLGADARRLLLWHEFLHLRRRDHLVRWFEVGIVGLYWWNPVAWWAVARLQQAEEDCCDAAVLVAHPHESARYGETLVSVAQFLSTGMLPTPSLSLGVARNHHIKRRLTMILHGPRWPELSTTRLAALSLLGMALVAVTWTASKAQNAPATPAASPGPAASVSPASPPQPAGKSDDVSVPDTPLMPIDEILVEGNVTIPTAAILRKMKIQAGRPGTPGELQEDLRTLIKTGWFSNVVPKYRHTDKKLVLVLVVVERPIVSKIFYLGAQLRNSEKLAAVTGLKVGSPYDIGANKEAARRIENFYHEQGYPEATVDLIIGNRPADRDVVFRIHEGVCQKVVWRYFVGNDSVSGERLAMELKSSPAYVVIDGKVDPANLAEDVAAVRKYYYNLGFLDATVTPTVEYSKDRKWIHLKYTIHEGTQRTAGAARASNGDTKNATALRLAQATPVPEKRDAALSQIKEMQPAAGDDELRKLQKERYNAALRELKLNEYQFDIGTTRVSAVCQATRKFVEAWQALAQQPADELRAVDWYVDYTNRLWNGAHARLMAGGTTGFAPVDEAEARAARFEAQIEAMKLHQRYEPSASKTDPHIEYKLEQPKDAPLPPRESQKRFTYERDKNAASSTPSPNAWQHSTFPGPSAGAYRPKDGRFLSLYLQHPDPMPFLSTDDSERRQLKEQYNAAARAMDAYQTRWREGDFDLAAHIENIQAAALKLRDAELAFCPDAVLKVGALGKYVDFLRNLQKSARTWVNADGSVGAITPLTEARLREAFEEMQLKMAQLYRELAQNGQGTTLPPGGAPSGAVVPVLPPGSEPRPVYATTRPGPLPQLLASRPLEVTPQDDARHKSLKEQYNAALRTLQDLQTNPGTNVSAFAVSVTANARQLFVAELGLARPNEFPRAYEHFIELMKYFDSIQIRIPEGSIEVNHIIAIDEARKEALKLLELKRISVHEDQSKRPAVDAPSPSTKATGSPPAAKPEQPAAPVAKAFPERLPLLLTRPPLGREARDDEWHKLLKERFNSAAVVLRVSYQRFAVDPATTATKVIAAARRVLEADLALTIDPEFSKQEGQTALDAWQRYFELMKFLEQKAEARFKPHIGGTDELEEVREVRLDAELKLLEAKQKLADRDQSRIQSTDAAVVVARAELDAAKATVERRKAELNRQTAHLAFQKIQYDRINRLYEQKAIEARLVTEQRDKRDAASAAVARAKEALDAAQSELSIKQVRFDQLAKLSQTK